MFEGASFLLFEKAKKLRKNLTGAEEVLWMYLRKGIGGNKFRRQHPIGIYIVDFFCYKLRLIVEVDGSIHNNSDTKSNDIVRQSDLEKLGYTVIRFNNADIYQHVDIVLNKILIKVNNINKTKLCKTESKKPPLGGWGVTKWKEENS